MLDVVCSELANRINWLQKVMRKLFSWIFIVCVSRWTEVNLLDVLEPITSGSFPFLYVKILVVLTH